MTSTSTDRRLGLTGNAAIKLPCRVATTGPILLTGEQTIDAIAVKAGDRVLVKDQADAKTNGVYVADTGAWSRATDFDGSDDIVQGTLVLSCLGTANLRSLWVLTTVTPEIDATPLAFHLMAVAPFP